MQRDSEIVQAVHEHWVLSGVGIDDANDMADELADHLTAAEAVWVTSTFHDRLAVTLPTWLVVVTTVATAAVFIGPLVSLYIRAEQTEGRTKRTVRLLDRFL